MALEISEIGVRMAVGEDQQPPANAGAQAGVAPATTLSEADRDDIVARCVAEVLRALKDQEAR